MVANIKELEPIRRSLLPPLHRNKIQCMTSLESKNLHYLKRCTSLLQVLHSLLRAQSSSMGAWFHHHLKALAPRASGNLHRRPKDLDQTLHMPRLQNLRASPLQGLRLQGLKDQDLSITVRLPQVPMPHKCNVECLSGTRYNGGTRLSRSLKNLSSHGNLLKSVDLNEVDG